MSSLDYTPLPAGELQRKYTNYFSVIKNFFSPLTIALIVLIFSRSIDRVLFTRITIDYNQYIWYLSNVLCPLAFLILSWPVVWYKMAFTKDITPEMRQFPQYKFVIMGILDTGFSLLSTFPAPHLGGAITNVMNQIVLPFNMLGSIIFLGTRYHKAHWVGACLAIYGVLVNLMPLFEGRGGDDNSDNKYYDPSILWLSINTLAYLFMAASNIYKEIALKDHDLDVWYTNAWIGIYQLVAGFLTTWTITIPAFTDPNPTVSFSQLGNYLYQATLCFFGHSSTDVTSGDIYPCDHGVIVTFVLFILFNIVFNMLMLYTFKSGSSVLFVISSAVALPLSDFLYTFPFIAGVATQPFTLYDGFALFVLVLSILVYYSEKEERVVVDAVTHKITKFIPATPMLDSGASERAHHLRDHPTSSLSQPLRPHHHYGVSAEVP